MASCQGINSKQICSSPEVLEGSLGNSRRWEDRATAYRNCLTPHFDVHPRQSRLLISSASKQHTGIRDGYSRRSGDPGDILVNLFHCANEEESEAQRNERICPKPHRGECEQNLHLSFKCFQSLGAYILARPKTWQHMALHSC